MNQTCTGSGRLIVLRACDHRRMPWKNGGGETAQIATFPADAALADFGWRVSMARVAEDGPFSVFPGIDRTLVVLEGGGMHLTIEGHASVTLTTTSPPLSFPADVATRAKLVAGPITDLNVMSRRGAWRHRVETCRITGRKSLDADAGTVLVLAQDQVRIETGPEAHDLGKGDCALINGQVTVLSDAPAGIVLITLFPV